MSPLLFLDFDDVICPKKPYGGSTHRRKARVSPRTITSVCAGSQGDE